MSLVWNCQVVRNKIQHSFCIREPTSFQLGIINQIISVYLADQKFERLPTLKILLPLSYVLLYHPRTFLPEDHRVALGGDRTPLDFSFVSISDRFDPIIFPVAYLRTFVGSSLRLPQKVSKQTSVLSYMAVPCPLLVGGAHKNFVCA